MSTPDMPPGIGPPRPDNGRVEPSDNGAATTPLEWLRARHEALTADRTLDMDVPGYRGRLVLRFGPVPWAVTGRLQKLLAGKDPDGRALLLANADMLIAACREVLARNDAGVLEPIDPTGEPCRIEPRLAELFGRETDVSARDTLLWLFDNDFGVSAMAAEVLEWTRTAGDDAADEFMGESAPAVK